MEITIMIIASVLAMLISLGSLLYSIGYRKGLLVGYKKGLKQVYPT
ncbi:hypothetical protein LCGC14_2832600 [marine sediment metagenome]|uniref:Uncharacterized protein n=1 Tax=marine sediment metagenome TaxID=412755 RepID=A0A0F9B4M3_9ZZZZ